MSAAHRCETCQRVFSKKAGLTLHQKRPCVKEEPQRVPNDWINRVQLGDCIAYMKQLPANSIDMVCTDPPYFLDGLGSDWNKESLDQKGSSSRVGNLPKGMKFDRNQSKQFHAFYTQVSREIFRVLKEMGL